MLPVGAGRLRGLRGFSMVELLVVIGIISVLIGLLLPALGAARRSSTSAACASNLRQISNAFATYALENHDRLPYAEFIVRDASGAALRYVTWDDLINKQLGGRFGGAEIEAQYVTKSMPVMLCPSDQTPTQPSTGVPDASATRRSYAIVRAFRTAGGLMGIAGTLDIKPGFPVATSSISFKMSEIHKPALQLAVCERPIGTHGPKKSDPPANVLGGAGGVADSPADQVVDPWVPNAGHNGPHGDKWNYLFMDGHVEALKLQETIHPSASGDLSLVLCNSMWTRDPRD